MKTEIKRITVLLEKDRWFEIKMISAKNYVSMSQIIKVALEDYVAKIKKEGIYKL